MKKILAILLCLLSLLLGACSNSVPSIDNPYHNIEIITKSIEGLDNGFIMGMDASSIISLENSKVKFLNEDDKEEDVFKILSEHGITHIRIRVWNNPYDEDGHGYGGGNCDLKNALEIGKRASKFGLKLIINFHYSDFWADPKIQKAPKEWASYSLSQKREALYNFTKESLQTLKDNEVNVAIVQVGNETTTGICGETSWENMCLLFNEGCKAVREVLPNALVALHFTNPENGYFPTVAKTLNDNNVDYDIFGTSYYPYWHGTLGNLKDTLDSVATTYNKKTMILETSYCYTREDTDGHPNTSPSDTDFLPHDISIQGQYDQIYDVLNTAKDITNCLGVCYWEGTWISVNAGSYSENKTLWEKYGSGWATSYAYSYMPNIVGTWYGGSAVDNQAFFNEKGQLLPSIKVFMQNQKA